MFRDLLRYFLIIQKKRVLIVNVNSSNTCIQSLRKERIWRISQANIHLALSWVQEHYVDLICLETDQSNPNILDFLKYIKNSRLKTTVLAVIPNRTTLKRILLSYGCDDFLCKPYSCEDLILRCKNLTNCIPTKFEVVYESTFLRYEDSFNRIMYRNTYIPLTPTEILIVKLLIKRTFLSKCEIQKYLRSKLGNCYSEKYIRLMIFRIRRKIKLSTGMDLIRNKYGCGYYLL